MSYARKRNTSFGKGGHSYRTSDTLTYVALSTIKRCSVKWPKESSMLGFHMQLLGEVMACWWTLQNCVTNLLHPNLMASFTEGIGRALHCIQDKTKYNTIFLC